MSIIDGYYKHKGRVNQIAPAEKSVNRRGKERERKDADLRPCFGKILVELLTHLEAHPETADDKDFLLKRI